jgi:hypothetical protein
MRVVNCFLQEAKLKVDSGIHSQAPVACASLCSPLIGSLHAAFQVAQIAVAPEQGPGRSLALLALFAIPRWSARRKT